MGTLRNIGLVMLTVTTIIAVLGTLAAVNGSWVLVAGLLFGSFIVCILTLLLIARYVAHHDRTSERRIKTITQKLAARVKQAMNRQDEALTRQEETLSELAQQINGTKRSITDSQQASDERFDKLDTAVSGLEETLGRLANSNRKQITNSIRDSTRQTESLVHIYQQYPDVKLPMPSTGGFAIDSQALAHLLAVVEERQPRRILELGSGTSTIWLGYLCRTYGGKLVSLDHLQHYLNLTRGAVDRHELHDVIETRLAPLEKTECDERNFNWYASDAMADLSEIDMLIVDGPPAATGPQSRYPSLPKLIEQLAPHATVILDDAHRDDEAEIVNSWLADYPEFEHIEKGTSRLAVLERTGQHSTS